MMSFSFIESFKTLVCVAQGDEDSLCINVEYNVLGPMLKVILAYVDGDSK